MGDSIIAGFDTYDLQIYAMGKGPSAMTVTAGPKVSTAGSSVIIEGTVMDNSPGLASTAIKLRFPNGVAAVSDESQSQWMMYVYKQFEQPTNATGVPVVISVVDANGNYRTVGTTTADANGFFSFEWTPDITGKYTIYATFEGSHAYYSSFAQTAISVSESGAITDCNIWARHIDSRPVSPTRYYSHYHCHHHRRRSVGVDDSKKD